MGLNDLSELDAATSGELAASKAEKRPRSILAPWDLPASKLLRNGKKSPIESVDTYEELWAYLKQSTGYQLYMSEFVSDDPIVRGVAISRTAQGLAGLCRAILTEDKAELKSILRPDVYEELAKEAELLLPRMEKLDGSGLPSRADKAMKNKLGIAPVSWRDEKEVRAAVTYLVDWLKTPSKLRKAMKTLQLGGLFYSTHVDLLCMNSFIMCGNGKASVADDAVARLCQAKPAVAGTKISYD